jgi:hypothetical protein
LTNADTPLPVAKGGTGQATLISVIPYSATPTFDASIADVFEMTLTGNVTSSSLINQAAGQTLTFIIHQDATGNRTFAWPSSVPGSGPIDPGSAKVSVQSFVVGNSLAVYTLTPMMVT